MTNEEIRELCVGGLSGVFIGRAIAGLLSLLIVAGCGDAPEPPVQWRAAKAASDYIADLTQYSHNLTKCLGDQCDVITYSVVYRLRCSEESCVLVQSWPMNQELGRETRHVLTSQGGESCE